MKWRIEGDQKILVKPDVKSDATEAEMIFWKQIQEYKKALEYISILGDANWKKYRAEQALEDIERINK
jgi:hypothetical protein